MKSVENLTVLFISSKCSAILLCKKYKINIILQKIESTKIVHKSKKLLAKNGFIGVEFRA